MDHESVKFLELLESDADGMYNLLTAAAGVEQFRRGYIRAQFAAIEGAIAVLRRHALLMKHQLQTGEMVLLEEKTYRINDKGKVKDSAQFLKFAQNVRFVFATTARVYDLDFELDKGGVEWKALLAGVSIRNRLTHPKAIADMGVSELEINVVRGAGTWFMEQSMNLLRMVLIKEEELRRERSRRLVFPWDGPSLGLDRFLPRDEKDALDLALEQLLNSSVSNDEVPDNGLPVGATAARHEEDEDEDALP